MAKKHDILWLDTVDSTNKEAVRRFSEIDNLSVVSALYQTLGRGQGTHSWLSEAGKNLLFSIVLKFPPMRIPASETVRINRITSASLVDFLSAHQIVAWIKEPNDIYVNEKKICGTLIENTFQEEYLVSSIIGIGLNINQISFDPSLPNPTSMVLETKKEAYDISACLDIFLDIFKAKLSAV